ncbi:hypothetical protein [Brasilonema sp. UFV-L1]|uniref:hypothetical protein n=1 Tax=Brasilonema sp. UFV-L1 TaxID=2234130 RepID=UPI00169061FF|nr:hypothetical protein [Brasilonema sp. UFV-L1]NMG09125.1 hypothetical protein [Brasilonema sp. UFV-L1]
MNKPQAFFTDCGWLLYFCHDILQQSQIGREQKIKKTNRKERKEREEKKEKRKRKKVFTSYLGRL